MKIRKFIFKFVNHENKTIHIFEFDVHSSKMHQWDQKDDDVEGYVKWLSHHARWEKTLKKEIKRLVMEKNPALGENFKDYIMVCEKSERKSKNINTNRANNDEMHFVQVFHMEKCMLKFVKGLNTELLKGKVKALEFLGYRKYYEINHLNIEDNEDKIVLHQILCSQGNKIIIPQEQNPNETKTQNVNVRPASTATNIKIQAGGNYDRDYEKYKRYKKKYLDLKNANY
jgi:hypothetical protein